MQLPQLISELQLDPENLGYAGKLPVEILTLINAPTRPYMVEPATPDVANFLVNHGMTAALMVAESSSQFAGFSNELKVAIKSVLMLNSSNTPTMNFENAFTKMAVAGIVQAGLWQQAQVDLLIETLANRTRSRSKELWGEDLTISDVSRVMWADKFAMVDAQMGEAQNKYNKLIQGINPDLEN